MMRKHYRVKVPVNSGVERKKSKPKTSNIVVGSVFDEEPIPKSPQRNTQKGITNQGSESEGKQEEEG